ncbi:MAG: hypothetical protein COU69_00565 [Candidatus Pacebacteria bacterium CG10_big_fil_rev_8_21_14_0_10_56_10]|nr:MAG: hypothetical protein COU69_00565 [Candidatus Pacebacteria bacterium CG10_big_fil_rev_8_21_14_0_10_56_10]
MVAVVAFSAVGLAACQQFLPGQSGQSDQTGESQQEADSQTAEQAEGEGDAAFLNSVVTVAVNTDNLQTFASALEAAGLLEMLAGEGPFTVFAPADEAFEALPAGTMADLLANPGDLAELIRYHVISGTLSASQAAELDSAVTLQGQEVTLSADGEVLTVNQATITTADIEADNGVIHVIDAVLSLPAETTGSADTDS